MASYNRTVALRVDPVYAEPFSAFVAAITRMQTVSMRRIFFSTLFSAYLPIAPRRFFAPPRASAKMTLDIERPLHDMIDSEIDVTFTVFSYNAVDHFIRNPDFRAQILATVEAKCEAYYASSTNRTRADDTPPVAEMLTKIFDEHDAPLLKA